MRRRFALKIVAMEAGGGGGVGVGGLGLSERERGSVFKQMGEMKKKIQVITATHSTKVDGTPDNATATKSCKFDTPSYYILHINF